LFDYPSGVDVSSSALRFLAARLRETPPRSRNPMAPPERRPSGPANLRPPAQRPALHPARGRIRDPHRHRLPITSPRPSTSWRPRPHPHRSRTSGVDEGVIDLASRGLAGQAIAGHTRAALTINALHVTEETCGTLIGATFHSDHGAEYRSWALRNACRKAYVTQSLQGRRAWDSARGPLRLLPLAGPLQHRPSPLPHQASQPDRLRTNLLDNINDAGQIRIIRVQEPESRPVPRVRPTHPEPSNQESRNDQTTSQIIST
jgi:hypothetical protein